MKALTIMDLRKELKIAFKENNKFIFEKIKTSEISVKNHVVEYVGDAADTILNGVQDMFDERDVKINQLSENTSDIKQDIKFMHQDIKDLNVDFSDKPSREQFEEFKSSFKNYPMI